MTDEKLPTRNPHKKVTLQNDTRPSRRSVVGTYDSASTNVSNSNYWQYVDSMSAVEANSENVRKTLRERSRFEFDNNSYCCGIGNTIAKDTVGSNGPRLRLKGDTDKHKKLETDYAAWQKEVGYSKKLRTARIAKFRDGECWLLPVTKKKLKNPVKLYLQLFETEQVGSYRETTRQKDGVYLDEFGEAEYFNLFDEHPGSNGVSMKGRKIKATDLIQYAYMTRPGQIRGIPETTPALALYVQLRSYTLSVLAASETAANLSAVLTTTAGAEDEQDDVDAEYEFDISRNSIKTMPFGWSIQQLKAEQPTTTYPGAKKEFLSEIGRCHSAPYNITALSSADYNYASGRLDFQEYWKALDVEQGEINNIINDPLFAMYAEEWMIVNNAKGMDLGHSWMYDSREHIDPVKEAKAETEKLTNNTTNLSIACAATGQDWQEVVDQRLAEEKYILDKREELGLPAAEEPKNDEEKKNEEQN